MCFVQNKFTRVGSKASDAGFVGLVRAFCTNMRKKIGKNVEKLRFFKKMCSFSRFLIYKYGIFKI